MKKTTEDALNKYGVGSCGPRGFYGTIDAHVKLEEAIAKFFNANEAIIYSDASSSISSAIPAFSNRSDLLVVDEGVNDNVLTGVRLSRAKVVYFKHNDMSDLEAQLRKIHAEDKKLGRQPNSQRRFIVAEGAVLLFVFVALMQCKGLYRNFGDLLDLSRVYELKMKYKWRLIVDESYSFGTIGANGKG